MLPDVLNLIELQKADREIQRLKDEVAALPKRVAVIEEKLAGTKASLEKAKASVKADEAAKRKYETAIQDLQGKISKFRDQSLAVKTNEQYKALLGEIQFAEQEIRTNEDKILEVMLNSETREKEVKAAELELKAEAAEIEKEKAEARQVTAHDEKQLAEWNAKRDQARGGVDESLLRQYDRVAKYRGTGIAEVKDQKCMGCQVMLRPQVYNEVRGGTTMITCDSCQRILFYDASKDVVVESAEAIRRRRAHPKFEASQAWYYRPGFADHGEVFLLFINHRGQSTRRAYDVHTGREIGDIHVREGEYRLGFPEDVGDNAIRLNGHWPEADIEEWGTELPMNTLDALLRDLDLAREAHAAAPKAKPADAEVSSGHTAAS